MRSTLGGRVVVAERRQEARLGAERRQRARRDAAAARRLLEGVVQLHDLAARDRLARARLEHRTAAVRTSRRPGNRRRDDQRLVGSGPGGIVHAVVTGSPTSPVTFDPAVLAECGHWSVISGNTTGTVSLIDAPAVEGATTVGMDTVAKTVVEGGMETTAAAYTFSAYLGDYLAFVTVVADPGSPNPALGQEFAADLLVKTVSALRG